MGRHAKRRSADGGTVARSSALLALGTVVSRATGLVRLALQAAALGLGAHADAYNTANTLPTSLYTLMIGGALNSVLVPQLVRARVEHPDGGRAHEQRLLTMMLVLLAAGTALALLFTPQIVALLTPSGPGTEANFRLTVAFARLLLPQVFFYGLFFILGQLLNARGRFGAMGWAPVLNNVVLIGLFGLYIALSHGSGGQLSPGQVDVLGIATTAGIALQSLCLLPALARAGFSFRPRFDWRGTGLRRSLGAARWTLLFVLVNQVALAVVTRYANAVDTADKNAHAGNTAYFFAQNIWMLPQSVITVSLVTAMLPRVSRAVSERRLDDARADLSRALRTTGVVIVPAAFFFLAFGPQIAVLLFGHGSGSGADGGPAAAGPLGTMLQAFALGLIPFSAQYLLLRGFYAFEDTRTPFWTAVWISVLDIALATACHLWLPTRQVAVGMAGAYAVSYAVGLLITAHRLRRRLERRLDGRRLVRTYGKLVAAASFAGLAGWAVAHALTGSAALAGRPTGAALSALTAGGVVMLGAFVLACRALGVEELRDVPARLPFRR
ncbi:murein biosynthesis integral membrane protein MurJ [Streptacidiphilus pinicola]|uniref:Murein biosynthesis integral membrane protein MurJ n=1 Tax=Streptacidiphilus pinicola TaxID=2219663 RepID=A0A2X0JBP7_9ACTN|nr:murein biosynthesis integral membrane protein MurJ [Streptacidiphilus pinicola]RAG84968.1 murein biosynthesis integral membrane protein MurJ [Streptacidiphilus pinicola]